MNKHYLVETKIERFKIMLKAKLSGEKGVIEEWFCFDTGSDVLVAPVEALKKIGAKKIKSVTVEGFGEKIEGDLYSVVVECGGVKIEGIEAYASNKKNYLIGMNFIMWGKLGFCFDRQQIIWIEE
jgi:predicted aspartyl protease